MIASQTGIPTKLAMRVMHNAGITPPDREVPVGRSAHGRLKYPLRQMEVGEHFFVPARDFSIVKTQNSVSSCVASIQRSTDRLFTQQRYFNGIRVWRIR